MPNRSDILPIFFFKNEDQNYSSNSKKNIDNLLSLDRILVMTHCGEKKSINMNKVIISIMSSIGFDPSKVTISHLTNEVLEKLDKNDKSIVDFSLYHFFYDLLKSEPSLKNYASSEVSWCWGFDPEKMESIILDGEYKVGASGKATMHSLSEALKTDSIRKVFDDRS